MAAVEDGAAEVKDVEDPKQLDADDSPTSTKSMAPSEHLRAADSPKSIPWQSFFLHSLYCLFFAVGLPWFLQLGSEFGAHGYRLDAAHRRLVLSSLTCAGLFPPWGLLVACGFAFFVGFLLLFFYPYERHILAKTVSCQFDDRGISSTSWFKRPAFVCCLLLFASLPLAAWTGRSVWAALLARELHSCTQECNDAAKWLSDHSSSKADPHHDDEEFVEACRNSSLNKLPDSRCGWNETAPLPAVTKLLGGSEELYANMSKMRCAAILHEKDTPYIRMMLRYNNIYTAFETRLRRSKQISLWDVYGAPCAVSLCIMMFCSRIAVSVKAESLNKLKKHMVLTVFCPAEDDPDSREVVRTHQRLFKRLGGLSGQEAVCSLGRFFGNLLKKPGDKMCRSDLYDTHEATLKNRPYGSSRHLRNNIKSVFFALIFSAGHALLPAINRKSSLFGDSKQPFFASPELAPALMLNALVSFLLTVPWFTIFVQSSFNQAEKLQLAIAFDCLWQFPKDSPMETTTRGEGRSLLQEASRDDKFNEQGYRVSFARLHSLGVDEMMRELHKLEEWYHLREYLEMDQIEAHSAMELAAVVAVCCLVPEAVVITYTLAVQRSIWLQHTTFLALWDVTCISFFIFRALMTTLKLNDWRDRHQEHLSGLVTHMRLRCAKGSSSVDASGVHDSNTAQPVRFVEALLSTLQTSDVPLSFAGMAVTRKIVTGFSSSVLLLLAPHVLRVAQKICREF